MNVLLVEDENNLGLTLLEGLIREGYHVVWAQTIKAAKAFLDSTRFDLVLLDVSLPDGKSWGIAEKLKKDATRTALIFLTAWGAPEDRIRGLEWGAQDYIVKPFYWKELLLRIANSLKRMNPPPYKAQETGSGCYLIGRAMINFDAFTAEVSGKSYGLTQKELALLKCLLDRRGQVVSRDVILNQVWSEDDYPTPRTVDNFIVRLRRLVEVDPEHPKMIKSVWGVGYQLKEVSE